MTPPLLPDFIYDLLQRSLIPDEYKGDFALAKRKLAATAVHNEASQFFKAILYLLSGHIIKGQELFDDLEKTLSADHPLQIRMLFYRWLAQSWQYNLFPDGNGAGALEIQARWQSTKEIEDLQGRIQLLQGATDPSPWRLEQLIIFHFLPGLQSTKSFIQSASRNAAGISSLEFLQVGLGQYQNFTQSASLYQIPLSYQAYAHLAAADLCHRAGDNERKLSLLQLAMDSYEEANDPVGMARCKVMLGDWYSAPFSSPLVLNYSVVDAYSEGSYQDWRIEDQEYSLDGANLVKASKLFREAATLFKQEGAERGLGQVQLRRSYLAWLEEDFKKAYQRADQAKAYFQRSGDEIGLMHAQTFMLLNDLAMGHSQKAASLAAEIGEWGRQSGFFSYTLGLGMLINRVARHWLIRKVDFEKALLGYRSAKLFFKHLDAPVNMAQSSVDEGKTYELMSEFDHALNAYESAADAYEVAMRRYPTIALDLHRFALMLVQSHYNLGLKRMDGRSIAKSMQRIKRLQAAVPALETGAFEVLDQNMNRVIAQLADTILSQASVFAPLYQAVAARDAGNTSRADTLFAKAEREAQRQPDNTFLLASVFGQQRKYKEAKVLFDEYLSTAMAGQGVTSDALKLLESFGGEQATQQLLKQQSRLKEQALTFMVRTKHFKEAKKYADELEAMNGADWFMSTDQPWLLLSDYGEMYEGLGDLSLEEKHFSAALQIWLKSLAFFERGLQLLEAQRDRLSRDELKTALGGGMGVQYLYFSSARLCVKICLLHREREDEVAARQFLEQSFNIAEKNKSKALLDLLEDSQQVRRMATAKEDAIAAWREKSAMVSLYKGMLAYEHRSQHPDLTRIKTLEGEVRRAEDKRLALENQILNESPDFYAMIKEEAVTLTLTEIIYHLPPKTTLLQYYFLAQDLIIWAFNSDGNAQVFHQTYDAKLLGSEARSFHKACQDQDVWEVKSKALSKKLLAPLNEEVFGKVEKLLIVPHGDLHLIPFAALFHEDQVLIDQYEISYLPSASSIQYLGKGRRSPWSRLPTLTIGNPDNMAFHTPLEESLVFSNLKGAGLEAAYIAQLTKGKNLSGEKANRTNVLELLPRYEVLHFSTHGYLSEHFPLMSAILLANGEALTVYDLIGMQLRARLVVMSACQTGLGERKGGDDLLGLTRGLLGAGAEAAMVTQWSVSDIPTALLMAWFYQYLQEKRSTPSGALRKAQLALRRLTKEQGLQQLNELKSALSQEPEAEVSEQIRAGRHLPSPKPSTGFNHPFYWAAMVYIGV